MEILKDRLGLRDTETEDSISQRLFKARFEITFEDKFDQVLINKDLDQSLTEAQKLVDDFINSWVWLNLGLSIRFNYVRIGLFFGSFNPIHIGHLIIANIIADSDEVDQVWFVVSPLNPFKKAASHLFTNLTVTIWLKQQAWTVII